MTRITYYENYQDLRVGINKDVIARIQDEHSWTVRSSDISSYSGDVELSLGIRISSGDHAITGQFGDYWLV